jgi:hypothetical protein
MGDFPQTSVDEIFFNKNTTVVPKRDISFRSIVNSFFQGLVFTRVERKDNYVIYAVKLPGQLGNGFKQYILLYVHIHNAIEEKTTIDNLLYINLQIRTLQTNYKIGEQRWNFKLNNKQNNPFFNLIDRNKERSFYTTRFGDFDIELLLKHNQKKNTEYQYQNRVTLTEAFETYNCILQIPS